MKLYLPMARVCMHERHRVARVVQVIKEAIYDAFYKLTDSRSQITAYVFDVVRASVPRMDLDEIFVVRAPS